MVKLTFVFSHIMVSLIVDTRVVFPSESIDFGMLQSGDVDRSHPNDVLHPPHTAYSMLQRVPIRRSQRNPLPPPPPLGLVPSIGYED
ncbi:hypothetical protein Lalb_Chr13g0293101 [Lupinus albus]|uniref:Uncharacterized protein n=1 Tax=Lupinus albus TaxID=3870 RepID=A0A6A4PHI6_LUPAL|nr:hypothetical protein Lalb_Chr13g0293101 [Lupinus albus]